MGKRSRWAWAWLLASACLAAGGLPVWGAVAEVEEVLDATGYAGLVAGSLQPQACAAQAQGVLGAAPQRPPYIPHMARWCWGGSGDRGLDLGDLATRWCDVVAYVTLEGGQPQAVAQVYVSQRAKPLALVGGVPLGSPLGAFVRRFGPGERISDREEEGADTLRFVEQGFSLRTTGDVGSDAAIAEELVLHPKRFDVQAAVAQTRLAVAMLAEHERSAPAARPTLVARLVAQVNDERPMLLQGAVAEVRVLPRLDQAPERVVVLRAPLAVACDLSTPGEEPQFDPEPPSLARVLRPGRIPVRLQPGPSLDALRPGHLVYFATRVVGVAKGQLLVSPGTPIRLGLAQASPDLPDLAIGGGLAP